MSAPARRHLHVDPFSGASGDMWLGLAADLGADPGLLVSLPERLGLTAVEVSVGRARRAGLEAGRVEVAVRGEPSGTARRRGDVFEILDRAALPARAARWAARAFDLLFEAEGRIHGLPPGEVHLHEAAADDALVDIAGTALALDALGIESVSCGIPVPLGGGEVRSAHGTLPAPAPAAAALLEGVPVSGGPVARELVTPTGAAILRAVASRFGAAPPMRLERAGAGAGAFDDPERPNVLRGLLGVPLGAAGERALSVLSCAVDDMPPSDLPPLIDRLLAEGARDAFVQPIVMKKGRPGFLVTVLAEPQREEALAERLLADSTTLGVRVHRESRIEWARDTVSVPTPWGPVRVKRAIDSGGRIRRGMPEFEDVRAIADREGLSLDEVRRAARDAFSRQNGGAEEGGASRAPGDEPEEKR
ncbi:MAG: nickel pincer cofactor biosynthesis protein LarC [Acidobacteria bacterium]|nr:MAG: nickel pincer cofactor biosynthesis protein LarC [Acidobacteriota bacterium]